jgi:hypothetical protein
VGRELDDAGDEVTRDDHLPPLPLDFLRDITPLDDRGRIYVSASLYGDEHPTWTHWCPMDKCDPGRGVSQWAMAGTPQHPVQQREPLTLDGSLLCPNCGLHGWIREGRWVNA